MYKKVKSLLKNCDNIAREKVTPKIGKVGILNSEVSAMRRLQKMGYVKLESCECNGNCIFHSRSTWWVLTEKGKKLLEQ